MTITITLPPATEERLRAQAEATGQNISALVVEALQEKFEEHNGASADVVPYEQWHADFNAWLAGHTSRNPLFDDSRESIYD